MKGKLADRNRACDMPLLHVQNKAFVPAGGQST